MFQPKYLVVFYPTNSKQIGLDIKPPKFEEYEYISKQNENLKIKGIIGFSRGIIPLILRDFTFNSLYLNFKKKYLKILLHFLTKICKKIFNFFFILLIKSFNLLTKFLFF